MITIDTIDKDSVYLRNHVDHAYYFFEEDSIYFYVFFKSGSYDVGYKGLCNFGIEELLSRPKDWIPIKKSEAALMTADDLKNRYKESFYKL